MRFRRITLLCLLATLALAPFATSARDGDYGKVVSTVAQLLKEDHYSGAVMDETLARRVLETYMDDLDYDHLYFTQGDVLALEATYSADLGNQILAGKADAALKVFDVYRRRVEDRVVKVRDLLKGKFDYRGNGWVETSREHSPWPKDEAQADALWHDRIEGDLLDEKLDGHAADGGAALVEKYCDETLRDLHDETKRDTVAGFLSALARSYDPHSEYLTKEDLDDLDSDMRLSMVGIGAVLTSEDGYVKVVDLLPGSPALADGHLKVNDRITGIAQGQGAFLDVGGMRLDRVLDKIRGKAGTVVRLQVAPFHATDPSQRKIVAIVRREIKLKDEEAKAEIVQPDGETGKMERLGWITVPSFYGDDDPGDGRHAKSLTRDVKKLLERLETENIQGLVLDLRGDGGGLLAEAVSLAGLFVGKGPIVQVKGGDGRIEIAKSSGPAVYDGPLIVLTDRLTASAAELFSGAMQDYGRAVIAGGEHTFGKGTVQAVLEIGDYMQGRSRDKEDAGALQLTIAKFYRVSGGSPQLHGVTPDLLIPSLEDLPNSGEVSERFPLQYDAILPVPFKKIENHTLFVPELQARSSARVAAAVDFAYLEEDLHADSQDLTANHISLNEAQRRAASAEDKAREGKRAAERAKRPPLAEKTYLVTLDNVRKPGLELVPSGESLNNSQEDSHADANGTAKPSVDAVREETLHVLADLVALSHTKPVAGAPLHAVR